MVIDSYTCDLCLRQREETLRHLFLHCSFTKNCWMKIGVLVPVSLIPERVTGYIKRALGVPFAMEIIIVMFWCIWKERNAWILTMRTH
jgi:hypothetical protein